MKTCLSIYLTPLMLLTLLCYGSVSEVQALPMVLNFEIEDPLSRQYNNAEFSYVIDKENPFWSEVDGDTFMSQNKYKYHVELYKADTILGSLPDLILYTTQMIGDVESGITSFYAGNYYDGDYMEIYTPTSWYFWDLIDNGPLPLRFDFVAQSLELTSLTHDWEHRPFVWLKSIEPLPVPEPSTLLLFGTGIIALAQRRRKGVHKTGHA
jgi:hypothetical protein